MQKTFSIIKPDAVKRNLIGHINQIIESADLKILASKKIYLKHGSRKKTEINKRPKKSNNNKQIQYELNLGI